MNQGGGDAKNGSLSTSFGNWGSNFGGIGAKLRQQTEDLANKAKAAASGIERLQQEFEGKPTTATLDQKSASTPNTPSKETGKITPSSSSSSLGATSLLSGIQSSIPGTKDGRNEAQTVTEEKVATGQTDSQDPSSASFAGNVRSPDDVSKEELMNILSKMNKRVKGLNAVRLTLAERVKNAEGKKELLLQFLKSEILNPADIEDAERSMEVKTNEDENNNDDNKTQNEIKVLRHAWRTADERQSLMLQQLQMEYKVIMMKNESDTQKLKKEHEAEIEKLRNELTSNGCNKAKEVDTNVKLQESYAVAMKELEDRLCAQHLQDMEEMRNQLRNKHESDIENKLDEIKNELESRHQENVQKIQERLTSQHKNDTESQINAVKQSLHKRHEEEIQNISEQIMSVSKKNMEFELQEMEQQKERELKKAIAECENKYEKEIQKMKEDMKLTFSEQSTDLTMEKEELSKKLSLLETKLRETSESYQKDNERTREECKQFYEAKMEHMKKQIFSMNARINDLIEEKGSISEKYNLMQKDVMHSDNIHKKEVELLRNKMAQLEEVNTSQREEYSSCLRVEQDKHVVALNELVNKCSILKSNADTLEIQLEVLKGEHKISLEEQKKKLKFIYQLKIMKMEADASTNVKKVKEQKEKELEAMIAKVSSVQTESEKQVESVKLLHDNEVQKLRKEIQLTKDLKEETDKKARTEISSLKLDFVDKNSKLKEEADAIANKLQQQIDSEKKVWEEKLQQVQFKLEHAEKEKTIARSLAKASAEKYQATLDALEELKNKNESGSCKEDSAIENALVAKNFEADRRALEERYSEEISSLQKEIDVAKGKNSAYEAKIESCIKQHEETLLILQETKNDMEQKEVALADQIDKLKNSAESEREKYDKRIKLLEAEIDHYKNAIKTKEEDFKKQEQNFNKKVDKMSNANTTNQHKMTDEILKLRCKLDDEAKERKLVNAKFSQELHDERKLKDGLVASVSLLEKEILTLKQKNASVVSSLEASHSKTVSELTKTAQEKDRQIKDFQNYVVSLQEETVSIKAQGSEASNKNAKLERQVYDLLGDLDLKTHEIKELKKSHEELQNTIASHEKLSDEQKVLYEELMTKTNDAMSKIGGEKLKLVEEYEGKLKLLNEEIQKITEEYETKLKAADEDQAKVTAKLQLLEEKFQKEKDLSEEGMLKLREQMDSQKAHMESYFKEEYDSKLKDQMGGKEKLLEELKSEYETKLLELEKNHETEMESIQDNIRSMTEEFDSRFRKQKSELSRLEEERNLKESQDAKKHNEEIAQINTENTRSIETLEKKYEEEMMKAKKESESAIAALKSKHDSDLKDKDKMKLAYATKMKSLFEAKLQSIKTDHSSALAKLQGELSEKVSKINTMEKESVSLKNNLIAMSKNTKTLETQLQSKVKVEKDLKNEVTKIERDLKQSIENSSSTAASLLEQQEKLEQEQGKLKQELNQTKRENSVLKNKMEERDGKIKALTDNLNCMAEKQKSYDEKLEVANALEDKLKISDQDLVACREELHKLKLELTASNGLVSRLQSQNESSEKKHGQRTALVGMLEEQLEEIKESSEQLKGKCMALEYELRQKDEDLVALRQDLSDAESQLRQQKDKSTRMANEHSSALNRHAQENATQHQKVVESLRRELQSVNQKMMKKSAAAQKLLQEREAELRELRQRTKKLQQEVDVGSSSDRRIFELAEKQSSRDSAASVEIGVRDALVNRFASALAERDGELASAEFRVHKIEDKVKELSRVRRREDVNLDYLKNTIVQFLSKPPGSRERASLLQVLATLLQFDDNDYKAIERGKQKVDWFWGTVVPTIVSNPTEKESGEISSSNEHEPMLSGTFGGSTMARPNL